MTIATVNLGEIAAFWRVARRLYIIYAELDRTFEIGIPLCRDLEYPVDRSEPEVLERVRNWFDQMDIHIHVWQLRQLLQSTTLQTEENLRYLINRHMAKPSKSEMDRDKIDFLLVQYFAHCAPQGLYEQQITLEQVAKVLEPALNTVPGKYPDWSSGLEDKLQKLNESSSLEELQDSGALVEVRELKLGAGEKYFEPACLVVFTRFNFLARRAFFRAMHLDLHAIRSAINDLESRGMTSLDCTEAGLSEHESMEHIRHIVHQWKTPFRAPYSGGSSFQQLIQMRHALDRALKGPESRGSSGPGAGPAQPKASAMEEFFGGGKTSQPSPAGKMPPRQADIPVAVPVATPAAPAEAPRAQKVIAMPAPAGTAAAAAKPAAHLGEDDYLEQCVNDISEQLVQAPPKKGPAVCPIVLAGCKLLIATWEAAAFGTSDDPMNNALKRTVAARTILHVSVDRQKKHEPTDLGAALAIAQVQVEEMKAQIAAAKEASNIDAAVNLAATTKRLLALIEEGEALRA